MNDKELKELAEFAARFLELPETDDQGYLFFLHFNHSRHTLAVPYKYVFEDNQVAPILAHLAKRKMGDMGLTWIAASEWDDSGVLFYETTVCKHDQTQQRYEVDEFIFEVANSNEYIALWIAIRKAMNHNK